MVTFFMELERGRMQETHFSHCPTDFNPGHEIFHAIGDIFFICLFMKISNMEENFFDVMNIVLIYIAVLI